MSDVCSVRGVRLYHGDSSVLCKTWPKPVCIVSDGAYGVGGFPGDPQNTADLVSWYRPHVESWSACATPITTLWFWNTEIGWATVHPLLVEHGWEYVACNVWNKGASHVAGNANTKTLRRFPVVTEVCVQYVRPAKFEVDGAVLTAQEWLRSEWARTGLPMRLANDACGVKNAATRKYLTADSVWYHPPSEAFGAMSEYANKYGDPSGRPYFSTDGANPMSASDWNHFRAKFRCPFGVYNVWSEPPVRGKERIKNDTGKVVHANQKPLSIMKTIIMASTDVGDVLWEPFAGLATGALAADDLGRRAFAAEVSRSVFDAASTRIASTGRSAS